MSLIKVLFINIEPKKVIDALQIANNKDFSLSFACNTDQSLQILIHERIDLIIINPNVSDQEQIDRIRACCSDLPILVVPKILHKNLNRFFVRIFELTHKLCKQSLTEV